MSNVIINKKLNSNWIKIFKRNNINIYNNFENFNKILNIKLDYVMNAISGMDGLYPTIKIIKHTKKIAIANKDQLYGWNRLIKNY